MPASETEATFPAVLALRNTACWPMFVRFVDPTAMTVSPGPTVAVGVDPLEVSPSDPVGSQVVPVPVLV